MANAAEADFYGLEQLLDDHGRGHSDPMITDPGDLQEAVRAASGLVVPGATAPST
jgi:hypothetical protein